MSNLQLKSAIETIEKTIEQLEVNLQQLKFEMRLNKLGSEPFKLNHLADINDTCLADCYNFIPSQLVKRFGKPQECDGYKVSGQYTFTDNDNNVFTLYDWKKTNLYYGNDDDIEGNTTPEKLWSSNEPEVFNIGCLAKNRHLVAKFAEWIEVEVSR